MDDILAGIASIASEDPPPLAPEVLLSTRPEDLATLHNGGDDVISHSGDEVSNDVDYLSNDDISDDLEEDTVEKREIGKAGFYNYEYDDQYADYLEGTASKSIRYLTV